MSRTLPQNSSQARKKPPPPPQNNVQMFRTVAFILAMDSGTRTTKTAKSYETMFSVAVVST